MAAYFAIISPRLIHAHKTWGSAFYSLPSFWFWADDWETCVNKYADCRKVRLATLPIEEQPTMQGYFHRHDLNDALIRLKNGAAVRLVQLFHPEGKWRLSVERKDKPKRIVLPHRGLYLIGLAALALSMCVLAAPQGRLRNLGPITLPVLLGLATFVVYVMATGWYLPTGPGHRFIMTLYMPLLWLVVQGGDQLRVVSGSRLANPLYLPATSRSPCCWSRELSPSCRTRGSRKSPTRFESASTFPSCVGGIALRSCGRGFAVFLLVADKPWTVELPAGKPTQNSPVCRHLRMVGRSNQSCACSFFSGRLRDGGSDLRAAANPMAPEEETPRWFWPLVIAAMGLTAFWGIQRLPQSLWDDEDSSLHRAVLGQYKRNESGELKLKETTWKVALWNYWKPANHQLQTILSKASLQTWRAIARPDWTSIHRACCPFSLSRRRSLVDRFTWVASQTSRLRQSRRAGCVCSCGTSLACPLCN